MDIKNMKDLEEGSFDVVLDKACLDCLFVKFDIQCGDNANENVNQSLTEIYRVLKPAGTYFMVSHGLPDNRLP